MTIAQLLEQKVHEGGIQIGEQRGNDRNAVITMTGMSEEELRRITD